MLHNICIFTEVAERGLTFIALFLQGNIVTAPQYMR